MTNSPADYGAALKNDYRPLEASLGLLKLPLVCEEYGINNGAYTRIPSALIPFWGEFERDGVNYASAGVYDNGGTLGKYPGPGRARGNRRDFDIGGRSSHCRNRWHFRRGRLTVHCAGGDSVCFSKMGQPVGVSHPRSFQQPADLARAGPPQTHAQSVKP